MCAPGEAQWQNRIFSSSQSESSRTFTVRVAGTASQHPKRGQPRAEISEDARIDHVGVGERKQMAGPGNVFKPRAGQHRCQSFGYPPRNLQRALPIMQSVGHVIDA